MAPIIAESVIVFPKLPISAVQSMCKWAQTQPDVGKHDNNEPVCCHIGAGKTRVVVGHTP